jgi:hypothetical protein
MTDTPGELPGRSFFSPSLLQQTSSRYASGQLTVPGIVFIGRKPFYKALPGFAWPTVLTG